MASTIEASLDDWLIRAADLEVGQYLKVRGRGQLDWLTARRALDKQYGPWTFRTSTHGDVLTIMRAALAPQT